MNVTCQLMVAIQIYQEEHLKLSPDNAQAILILDNAPAYPCEEKLKISAAGKMKVLYNLHAAQYNIKSTTDGPRGN